MKTTRKPKESTSEILYYNANKRPEPLKECCGSYCSEAGCCTFKANKPEPKK